MQNAPREEYISIKELAQDRKQLKGFLSVLKTENDVIGKQLAVLIEAIGKLRTSQLGINLLISELKTKL